MTTASAVAINYNRVKSDWNDENVALLRSLYEGGKSATKCAEEINKTFRTTFSRNAVIGKIHRLDLHRPPGVKLQPRQIKRNGINNGNFMRGSASVKVIKFKLANPTGNDLNIPQEQRKQFLQLRSRDCRWPVGTVGEGDFFFCGGDAVDGAPYCKDHCARAYRHDS